MLATLLVSSGIRFCEAIGLQPDDFDFDAGVLEVALSVVKVSRAHHPQGKPSWSATTRRTGRRGG